MNVLFVCTGNTCRSPLAEDIARRAARAASLSLRIGSAGTAATAGEPATRLARDVARDHGGDLTNHRARPLTRTLVEDADLVLVMTPEHAEAVGRLGGAGRVRVLAVEDPLPAGTRDAYERTYAELEGAIGLLVAEVAAREAAA